MSRRCGEYGEPCEALWCPRCAPPLTLEQANEQYKGVARIARFTPRFEAKNCFSVYDGYGYFRGIYDNLEDAIEACRYLDNYDGQEERET